MADGLNMSNRIRRTPYTEQVIAAGVRGFSVVNHMLLPKAFQATIQEDYWHLREHVQLWDVSCQRQVQIQGPDAARLVQWMTPRDISRAAVGDCLYVPIINDAGGMINDPVLLKLADDRFWLSISDSDLLLYAKGLAIGGGLTVTVDEPDVAPLAVQGPKAEDLLAALFGEHLHRIRFFKFGWIDFLGTRQLIARSGYSRQGGFEIYLEGGHLGGALWETIFEAGRPHDIRPGCPNLIERIEGGLLSYGYEMSRATNPLELGLGKFCSLNSPADFIGKAALRRIAQAGLARQMRGVLFDGGPCPTCSQPWPVLAGDQPVGQITSAAWSPRLERNVGLSLIDRAFWQAGQAVTVASQDGESRPGEITDLPL